MAEAYKYPDRVINYRVYLDGENEVGVASVDLPELTYLTETVAGAGIAGNIESPLLGHFDTMSCTINFTTPNKDIVKLLESSGHTVILRPAIQHLNGAENTLAVEALKITMGVLPKTGTLGSLEMNATSDSSAELEVTTIKIERDGEVELEIDKINFVCKIGGNDVLTDVRTAIGM